MRIDLRKRRLQGNISQGEAYRKLDLSSAAAFRSQWTDCDFEDCEITTADFSTAAIFENCTFKNCDMRLTSFRGSALRKCEFVACDLRHSSFGACCPVSDTMFRDCNMQHASFFEGIVLRTVFSDCDLLGADLRFNEASELDFTGSKVWNAHVQIGCQFFNQTFDAATVDSFVAIAARVHPDPEKRKMLSGISEDQFKLVCKFMDDPMSERMG